MYFCTHVKFTRQWKSTFRLENNNFATYFKYSKFVSKFSTLGIYFKLLTNPYENDLQQIFKQKTLIAAENKGKNCTIELNMYNVVYAQAHARKLHSLSDFKMR